MATALAFFVAFWLATTHCRVFGPRRHGDLVVGALVFAFIVFASWLSCHLFAGRAAFLLVGVMMATTMTANVAHVIIPGQRKVVAALREGRPVDPVHGQRGKQRSVHNTYFTLPVVFTMISNHYGFVFGARHNWVVLVVLMLAGALIRVSFVLRHKALVEQRPVPWRYASSALWSSARHRRAAAGAAGGTARPRHRPRLVRPSSAALRACHTRRSRTRRALTPLPISPSTPRGLPASVVLSSFR